MKKLFDGVSDRIAAFVVQRDLFALAVRCREAEAPVILKILEGVADASPSDLYWTFTEEFTDPAAYVSAVVKNFSAQHGAVRLAMEKEGIPPCPPFPAPLLDESRAPALRLREAMSFSRSLIPVPGGGQTVWVLFPLQDDIPDGFGKMLREALYHEIPFAWCHNIRVILREDPKDKGLAEALSGVPRVDWYAPDLSQQAMESAILDAAADPDLPMEQRAQSVLLLAGTDVAHKRYPEALEKYHLILLYYAKTDNPAMAALVLNGIGECHERLGDAAKAEVFFASALEPGCLVDPPPVPILLNIFLNLANLTFAQSRWEEAEAYYDGAEKMATAQLMPRVKVQSVENMGVARYRQGKIEGAVAAWSDAAEIAKNVEETDLRRSLLTRLRDHYAGAGNVAERDRMERELSDIPVTTESRG